MRRRAFAARAAWIRYAVVAVVTAVVVAPIAGIASDRFTDVPDTNIFHNDIGWLADNGVTLGCNPPANDQFCPSDVVTREQMAAFMRRLATNKVVDAATAVTADDADTLDGMDSTAFLGVGGKAADSDKLDGMDSTAFLGVGDKAADSDKLDGLNSTDFFQYGGTVPAFETIVGAVGTGETATGVGDTTQEAVSFPVKMPGNLTAHVIRSGDPVPAGCSGSVSAPGASPGNLCVFIDYENNISSFGFYRSDGVNNVTSPYGGQVYAFSAGAGNFEFAGTWAATAPLLIILPPPFSADDALGSGS